jgi:hypothetical protein
VLLSGVSKMILWGYILAFGAGISFVIQQVTLPPGIDPTRIRVWPDRGPDDEGQQAH